MTARQLQTSPSTSHRLLPRFVLGLLSLTIPLLLQAQPAIKGIRPNKWTAGGPGFTLTVSGGGFVKPDPKAGTPGSQVLFGSAQLSTTFVSESELQASVSASDVATAGSVNVKVINPDKTVSNTVPFTVNPPPVISPESSLLRNGMVGAPYERTFTVSGGTTPFTWAVVGILPPGLSLSSSGVLSGTPTMTGSWEFGIKVTDAATVSDTNLYGMHVKPALVITTGCPMPVGAVGASYSYTFAATGGTPPYTWRYYTGIVPVPPPFPVPGLSFGSSTGTVSGTPTSAGTYQFPLIVTDGAQYSVQQNCSITINPALQIDTACPIPPATEGASYSFRFTASGGFPPYSFSLSPPIPGLTMSTNGTLSGTPASAGNYAFKVTVVDGAKSSASMDCRLTVNPPPQITSACPLPDATVGAPYSFQFTASGGTPPYTFSALGNVPGTTFRSNGTLSGTPSTVGTFPFSVIVRDANNASASKSCSLTVVSGPLKIISSCPLPDATLGAEYSQTLAASGGKPPYAWSLSPPIPGLRLSSGGLLSGVPTTEGAFRTELKVVDDAQTTVTKDCSITVSRAPLSITTACPLPDATQDVAYSHQFTASGGEPPYTWSLSPPIPGLTLRADGLLSGTPTSSGTFPFQVRVVDAALTGKTMDCRLLVKAPSILLEISTTSPLPDGTLNVAYSVQLVATGGSPPYRWSFTGQLPSGLAFGSNGLLSGTPTRTGTYTFTARVDDSARSSVTKTFQLTIASVPALRIVTASPLPGGVTGTDYSQQFQAEGGRPPYTWSLAPAPPSGLAFSADGLLSGIPASAGSFTFTVTVTDSAKLSNSKAFSLLIAVPPLEIITTSLPGGTAGSPYTVTLASTGGTPPCTWSLMDGSLPPGLNLSAEGVISGTPTAGGTFRFTAQVTDQAQVTVRREYALTVTVPPPPPVSVTGLPPTVDPAQQPRLALSLDLPYPLDINGRATLTFEPDAVNPADDPAVQFSTGGRVVDFTVPANQTGAVFPAPEVAIQTGTVAGLIVLTMSMQAGGTDITPAPAPETQVRVERLPPTITSVRVARTSGGFEVRVTGYSTPRQITRATFRFTAAAGANLQTSEITVNVDSAFTTWYQSETSAQFGSSFLYTQPFTVQGNSNALSTVAVTLTNAQGVSPPVTASF